ncbi:Transglutaminase-like superfamily protein [Fodinibius salinus]|uniref:Transglutaminase-like superfamily protein n=1 Tax=Fodinibius salinus TaxID=860790 RepID=A0A5D3YFS4_9BACT|nr:transglutaminase-like domain-containing protein [Fodinibius salinus]TYP92075.1 Transglutaminase-like superfamily protein [Fodinibius salinus]
MALPIIQIHQIPNSQRSTPRLRGGNGSVRPGNSPFMIRQDYPGLDKVLSEMKRLVKEYKGNPKIRDKAVTLTKGIAKDGRTGLPDRRNYHNIASAVYDWMKQNIAYIRDPDDIEWLQTPLVTLKNGYGDCDDLSVLAGALLSSIGVPTQFKVVKADRRKPNSYSHVYLEYKVNGSWQPFDPTLHTKAGDGLNDSQIFDSRTILLSDGLSDCGCGCGGSCSSGSGLSDVMAGANWNMMGLLLLGTAFGFAYWKQNLATT